MDDDNRFLQGQLFNFTDLSSIPRFVEEVQHPDPNLVVAIKVMMDATRVNKATQSDIIESPFVMQETQSSQSSLMALLKNKLNVT